jgi:glycosyltransferase involved in cell wall biosynthesis
MEAILDNEFSVLQHGIYNLGFLGVKNSLEGRKFAAWWADRLSHFCYDDIPRGIFTDQRWVDLVPAYFSEHKILRDSIYNVCTWNLTHRTVTGSIHDGFFVNDQPIAFYHFSGLDSGAQRAMLDKYGQTMPALYELRDWYITECARMGQNEVENIPWTYGFFENGERILKIHRKRYRERPDLQMAFSNPFSTSDVNRSYLEWFNINDKSNTAAAGHAQFSEAPITPYRVFVIAAPGDSPFIEETLDRVSTHTFQNESFLVTTPGSSPSSLPDNIHLLLFEAAGYDDLFATVLERFNDSDAVLIRAGAIPPEKWDLRLAWSAARQAGAATVSPIDLRQLDRAGTFSKYNEAMLDSLCYLHRNLTDPEIASFSHDCVYVRAVAIRDILGIQRRMYPSSLADGAARLRYSHFLATHVCMAWRRPRDREATVGDDSTTAWSLKHLHERIRAHSPAENEALPSPAKATTAANLHIMHSWGGGLERWVVDYCHADGDHRNLVLKSVGTWGSFGRELHLFGDIRDVKPLRVWPLTPNIKATTVSHHEYAEILSQIVYEYGVGRIIVSSLIGHSLDALRQSTAILFVCHDYYPFCPALNITFGSVCLSCSESRLTTCTQDNPLNRLFTNVPAGEWMVIRQEFAAAVRDRNVALIAPSPSILDNYSKLLPGLAEFFHVIPHGIPSLPSVRVDLTFESDRPFHILILGRLSQPKGGLLLECILPALLSFANLTLAGCGEHADPYTKNPRITIIPEYKRDKLPDLIRELQPDVGLLLSVVPETFSYTLAELQSLAVPTLATCLGSFADRIHDGVTGFLCPPEPQAIIARLKSLAADRRSLLQIHKTLKTIGERSVKDMLNDYAALSPIRYSAQYYFDGPRPPEPLRQKSLRLYWRTAQGEFCEIDSLAVAPLGDKRQQICLHFPRQQSPITELRLDFSNQPGFFLLHDLSLRDEWDNLIWQWNGERSSLKKFVRNEILFIDSWKQKSECLLYFTGNDPYLLLPISDQHLERTSKGGYLEVEFTIGVANTYIDALVSSIDLSSSVSNRYSGDAQAEVEFQQTRKDSFVRRLEGELQKDIRIQHLESTLTGIEDSLSWRVTRPARALAEFARRVKRSAAGVGSRQGR